MSRNVQQGTQLSTAWRLLRNEGLLQHRPVLGSMHANEGSHEEDIEPHLQMEGWHRQRQRQRQRQRNRRYQ